ncbi:MAG: Ig-like domain-containing protein, partial [Candidatus Marinimicrobia bacterium]|nr:Ig-like domain-containing protein [Candidatus Neomarinimicrobiota bacterium]
MGNNKLTGFIIIFSFLALGCGRDSYNSNREEFSIDLLVDRTAPVAILTTAIISSSGNAMVQSTETGTVYLVNTNVTVTNLASITGAADNQWNSAALSSLSVLTLPATGLEDGIYKAYAVDDAGNLSNASTNSVTIDSIAPTANFTAATDNVGSITGALTSGSITDDTALVLTGTNESGSEVKIYNGSTEIGSATVSGTNWSYTATVANGTTYQFNVKETDLAGHTSDATSNFTVTGDTVAPTASVATAAITSNGNAVIQSTGTGTVVLLNTSASTTSGNAVVQSSETGTVYLVKTTVTVTNLASITGAALYQWNSVAISSASTNTNLSVAGLADGTYKVYAVDEAGGLSSASVNSVIIDTTPPSIESVAITSAVGITGNLLNTGDVVSVTTTFTEQVIVDNSSGSPTLTLVVGSTNRTATYASGSGSTMLVFQYTIQSGENDSDGISIEANALDLNNATISDPIGFPAVITHSAVSANSSYLVDAKAPPVISFTLLDTELKIGDNATVILIFSEAVLLFSSSDDITISNLDNGTPSGTLSTMESDDNLVWEGTFTPTPNTEDATNTLSLGTSYTDSAGNTGVSATTANYEIDTLAPTISGVAIDNATGVRNDFVNAGDVVSVTATFSESVIVDNGTPTLTLILGSVNRSATYVSGSGSRPLVFQYTIQTGDNDSNGISIGTDALDLDNATIRDAAGN